MAKQSTIDDLAKLATPTPLREDVLQMAKEARKDQGIHEQEVSFSGEAGLQDSLILCEKNPGHKGFTPIAELRTELLPETIRYPGVAEFLISKAKETVRISCSYTSSERPDNYCFSNYRGRSDLTRYGSGRVWSVYSERVRYDVPCPFADCTEQRGTEYSAEIENAEDKGDTEERAHEATGNYSNEGIEKCNTKNRKTYSKISTGKDETLPNADERVRQISTQNATTTQYEKTQQKVKCESNISNKSKLGKENSYENRTSACSPSCEGSESYGCFVPLRESPEQTSMCDKNMANKGYGHSCETKGEIEHTVSTSASNRSEGVEKDRVNSQNDLVTVDKEKVSCINTTQHTVKTTEDGVILLKEKIDSEQSTLTNTQPEFGVAERKDTENSTPAYETGTLKESIPEITHQPTPPPHHVSGFFRIHTAKHVVFNDEEARQTTVEFFYDDHNDVRRVIRARGVRVARSDLEGDYCVLDCVTHDRNLGPALDKVRRQWTELWFKIKDFLYGLDLSMVVSHPHGCAKQFSIGQCLSREWGEAPGGQGWYRYTYNAATCPGSSGAPVWVPGRDGLFSGYAPHSGSCNGDVARSAVWFFWNQQKKQE